MFVVSTEGVTIQSYYKYIAVNSLIKVDEIPLLYFESVTFGSKMCMWSR